MDASVLVQTIDSEDSVEIWRLTVSPSFPLSRHRCSHIFYLLYEKQNKTNTAFQKAESLFGDIQPLLCAVFEGWTVATTAASLQNVRPWLPVCPLKSSPASHVA